MQESKTSFVSRDIAKHSNGSSMVAVLLAIGFLLLASWFIVGPNLLDDAVMQTAQAEVQNISLDPLRNIMGNPPTTAIAGSQKICMDCHQFIKPTQQRGPRAMTQHQQIVVDHGLNDRCLNCHYTENRNMLVTLNGSPITYDEVELLCASCHGTTYRDWQSGAHGKIFGSWMKQDIKRGRLTCTQCHDPHQPAFGQMKALPGPHTLRVVDPGKHADMHSQAIDRLNPLRRWHYQKAQDSQDMTKEQY